MASINVHLSVGLIASGIAATAALVSGWASPAAVLPLFVLGVVGSMLPDVDADSSLPVRVVFSLLSIVVAFLVMLRSALWFSSLVELLLVWVATYAFFRFLVFALFTRLTAHRGVFHSIPATLFSGFLTAALAFQLFAVDPADAWLAGGFVAFGYLVHLALDELYSVNLFGTYTRRSLGTALKLGSRTNRAATVYVYLAMLAAYFVAPDPVRSYRELAERGGWAQLVARATPDGRWFEPRRSKHAGRPASGGRADPGAARADLARGP